MPQFVPVLRRLSGRDGIAVGELCQGADPRLITALIALLENLASDGVILKESSYVS